MTVSRLCRSLGVRHAVFQAPIGGVASPELAAAVANAGGVGHLACTWRNPADLTRLVERMRNLTDKIWGVNLVMDFPVDEHLAVLLDHRVPVVSFFWGSGERHVRAIRNAGSISMQVVGSPEEAAQAVSAGFDIIVAQGHEAGGHVRGGMGTMALVPQVVDLAGDVPVVAAGGIADRRGVAAAIALGASGVWVGTRFLCAEEANIHPVYRERVTQARGDATLYSQVFDIGWPDAPMRTLKNETTDAWIAAGRPAAPNRPSEGTPVAARADGSEIPRYFFGSPGRDVSGNVGAMALYAGQAVGLVNRSESAAAIVTDLAAGLPGDDRSAATEN